MIILTLGCSNKPADKEMKMPMLFDTLEQAEKEASFSACSRVSNNIGIFISLSAGLFEHPNVRIIIERKWIREIEFFKINLLIKGI